MENRFKVGDKVIVRLPETIEGLSKRGSSGYTDKGTGYFNESMVELAENRTEIIITSTLHGGYDYDTSEWQYKGEWLMYPRIKANKLSRKLYKDNIDYEKDGYIYFKG